MKYGDIEQILAACANGDLDSFNSSQDLALFQIGLIKSSLHRQKLIAINNNKFSKILIVEDNFGQASEVIDGVVIQRFASTDHLVSSCLSSPSEFAHSVAILTNNNISSAHRERLWVALTSLPSTVFIGHDFDNHHWTLMSLFTALLSDVYCPAHWGDYSLTSRFNGQVSPNIPCGSLQWSSQFIRDHVDLIFNTPRVDDPLGAHIFYPTHRYRNQVVATLSKSWPNIRFTTQEFHARSMQSKFEEWVRHKLHFIIPVRNDLPIRFFDSLLTGGIPIVPTPLVGYLDQLGIPGDLYITYSESDVLDATHLVARGVEKFNAEGLSGITQRHNYSRDRFSVDATIAALAATWNRGLLR